MKRMNNLNISKKKTFIFLCAFLISFLLINPNLFSQNNKKYPSLFWEISGNGLEKPSYIYGTMHVSKKIAFHLSDTFFIGIENADIIALETNPVNWMEDILNSGYLNISNSLMKMFGNSNDIYGSSFPFEHIENNQIAQSLSFDHNLINSLLYRFSDGMEDFEEQTYLDMFIYQAAKKQSKNVVGLENFKESLIISMKAIMPSEEDKDMKTLKYNEIYETYQKINDAYRAGDLDLLDSLNDLIYPRANYRKYMLDIRNRKMVHNIDSILQNKSMFIGVGAAHLPGDSGMIEMLRLKGYKLRPIKREVTKNSRKKTKEIQEDKVAMSYSKHYSEDSTLSILAPGKIYNVPAVSGSVASFHPEMTNGSAYVITRIKTYGKFFDKSTNDYFVKIDSLLYENIPGEIIKQKEITINGFNGFDIHNKNKKGDEQFYRILITPFEIIVFKISNSGELKRKFRKEITNAIDNFTVVEAEKGWSVYKHKFGEFELNIPNNRLINSGITYNKNNSSFEIQALDDDDKSYFLFRNENLYEFDYVEQDTFELNMFVEKFAEEMKLDIIEQKFVKHHNQPASSVKYLNNDSNIIYTRFIIKGAEYYMLLAKTESEEKAEDFFNSFKFQPYKYDNEFETRIDTNMNYSVKVVDIEDENSILNISQQLQLQAMEVQRIIDEEDDNSYKGDNNSKIYLSQSTHEEVFVDYYKKHLYYHTDSIKYILSDIYSKLSNYGKLKILNVDTISTDYPYILICNTGDSASSRYIKNKIIIQNSSVYIISAIRDTLNEESEFLKAFFDSFKVLEDTNTNYKITDSKKQFWYDSFYGNDSLQKDWAINSIYYIKFDESDFDSLVSIYNNFDFTEYEDFKEDLIKEIRITKHKNADEFLINTYHKNKDNIEMHMTILEELASVNTDKAYKFIKKALMEEPPLTGSKDVKYLFSRLSDTLSLCTQFYPDFFELHSYQEYESSINMLLKVLLDSGLVSKDIYQNKISYFLRKANNDLRRKLSSEAQESSSKYESYNKHSYDSYRAFEGLNHIFWHSEKTSTYNSLSYSFKYLDDEDILLNYVNLFLPFKDQKEVARFFAEMTKVKDDDLIIELVVLYLQHNINVTAELISKLTEKNQYRYNFYIALEENDLTEHFNNEYLKHDSLIVSKLYYKYYEGEKDSIIFIEKYKQINRQSEGYVYIYKSKKEDDDNWVYDYVYLINTDSADYKYKNVKFIRDYADLEAKGKKEVEEEYEEIKDEILMRARCYGRERVVYESDKNNYPWLGF